jgi:hypothetical protein
MVEWLLLDHIISIKIRDYVVGFCHDDGVGILNNIVNYIIKGSKPKVPSFQI